MSHFTVLMDLGEIELDDASVQAAAEKLLAPYDEGMDVVAPYRVRQTRRELAYRLATLAKEGVFGEFTATEPDWDSFDRDHGAERREALDEWESAVIEFLKDRSDAEIAAALSAQYDDGSGEIKADKDGLYDISTYNPNSKWDWWSLGGRWRGFFKLKVKEVAAAGIVGEPGVFDNEPMHPDGVDVARQGDIDWEGMFEATKDEAGKRWDALTAAKAEKDGGWPPESLGTREEYLLKHGLPTTFAFVNSDGEWFQQGRMGWFGMSSDEKPEDDWASEWAAFVESVPENHVMAVVDCHI